MTPRERILAILHRQPVDRLPVDPWHTPEIGALLRQHCGVADDLAMYQALGLDKIVWVFLDYQTAAGERAGGRSEPAPRTAAVAPCGACRSGIFRPAPRITPSLAPRR